MTAIDFSAFNEANAKAICDKLNGRTFYNLKAVWYSYPCKGNEFVAVSTEDESATPEDLYKVCLSILSENLK